MEQTERNLLSGLKWRALISKAPTVSYMMQKVNIPAITLPPVGQPTPNVIIPHPGDTISFDHLYLDFAVDQDLQNYLEVYQWIIDLGFPETSDQFAKIQEDQVCDISVHLLDAKSQSNVDFIFRDAFPIYLGDLNLDETNNDTGYVHCMAIFAYPYFNVIKRNTFDAGGF